MKAQAKKGSTAIKRRDSKVSIFTSIRTQIILLMTGAIVFTAGIYLWTIIPITQDIMSAITRNYMDDVAKAYGAMLDNAVLKDENALSTEYLETVVSNISINEIPSSYAYVVARDMTMLYHPTADKIGQPVENAVVTKLIEEINAGRIPEPDVVTYEFKGAMKYAAYYVGTGARYILVISADEKEMFSSIDYMVERSIKAGIFALVIFSIIGFWVTGFTVKPINRIADVVARLSDMDFTEDDSHLKLNRRKDETGSMSRAITGLREQLSKTVSGIKMQSEEIYHASETLTSSAKSTASTMEEVEKTVAEVAEGATGQAQETQRATENVILMGNMVEETNKEVEHLKDNASSMRVSGDEAVEILTQLEEINKKTQEAIRVIYEQTNTTNESAAKIKEATVFIASIAEETNLLSLNATIEAARAGEQGRGFAVVAAQIQKLAEQSDESARQIETIVNSLISDSEKAVETMDNVKNIIGKQNDNVNRTNEIFGQVKEGIDQSVEGIKVIADSTRKLDEARVNVVDIVQNLTAIAEENAASSEETSASVSEVNTIVSNISDNSEKLKGISDRLEEYMEIFKL